MVDVSDRVGEALLEITSLLTGGGNGRRGGCLQSLKKGCGGWRER